jgi:hypothetical protein
MCKSTDNSFFISGRTGGETGYLLRINKFGDTVWTKTFSGGRIIAVCSSDDGGCVFINNLVIKKVDSTGVIVWQKTDTLAMTPYDIIQTTDGGYLACGIFGYNSKVMRFDAIGNLKWSKEYLSSYELAFYSIKEALNTGYIIAGTDWGIPAIDTEKSVLLHIDDTGNTIWEKKHKIFNRPTRGSSIEINDNNYYLSGTTFDSGQYFDKTRPFFIVADTNGNIIYSHVFPGANNCEGLQDIKILGPNKIIFTSILITGSGCNDSIQAKIFIADSLGNILITKIITASQNVELKTILPLINGDILFSGVLENTFTNHEDILVIRTDSILNSPPIGIKNINASFNDKFELYQNFPNPFNSSTKITFTVKERTHVKLSVFDVTGKKVAILEDNVFENGSYTIMWKADDLSSGIYFCRIEAIPDSDKAEKQSLTKKMLLIK